MISPLEADALSGPEPTVEEAKGPFPSVEVKGAG